MEFLPITSAGDHRIQEIYASYTTTFPVDEQRDQQQFLDLFSNPKVGFMSVVHESEAVGYLILWELGSFVFVEHFNSPLFLIINPLCLPIDVASMPIVSNFCYAIFKSTPYNII